MSIDSVMLSNHLILCRPLLLPPSVFPSIRVFSNESVLASGGQSIGVSGSALVLPMNIQDWFPVGLNGLISLQSKGLSRVFSNTTVQKHQFFGTQLYSPTLNLYMTTGKSVALTRRTFVGKVISLFFRLSRLLSRLVIAFLPRSKHLLIYGCNHHLQWFWSPKKWSLTLFPHLFPMKWWDQMP